MDRRTDPLPNTATRLGPPTSQAASYQRRQSQNSNRLSLQSENPSQATSSPFQSPLSPEFPPESGLAPRPSSFPYGGPGSEAPVKGTESSRQRDARNRRRVSLDKPLPPPPTDTRDVRSNNPTGSDRNSRQIDPSSATSDRVKSFSDRSRPQGQSALDPHRVSSRGHRREVSRGQGQVYTGSGGTRAGLDPATQDPSSDPSSPEQRREWAPDRSPLQKLELTLQDISNEEHRAQTEEAELLARDARAGRGSQSRRTGRSVPSEALAPSKSVNKDNNHLAEAGLVRNLSIRHKDRLQRSATVESRKPDETTRALDPSTAGGFEYQEQEYNRTPESSRATGRNGTTRANGVTGPSNPDSRNQAQQNRLSEIYDTDVVSRPNQARSASYRRSKPPGEPNPDFVAPAQDYRARNPASQSLKSAAPQTASGHQARPQVGYGTEAAVATAVAGAGAATMAGERRHMSDIMHLHRRPKDVGQTRSSVPDPVNQEWRSGKVARLTRADLIVNKPSAAENKAWWEERQSSRRRAVNGTAYSKTAGISGLDGGDGVDQGMLPQAFDCKWQLSRSLT
jgi:hypothetical protein